MALLCHRSDQSFSQETKCPEPERCPRTIAENTEYTEGFLQEETEGTEDGGLAAKSAKGAKVGVGGCHKVTELGHRGGGRTLAPVRPLKTKR